MASFYDTTVGQQIEFQRVLASAGFTDEHIARVIKEPTLASAMYASIQPTAPVVSTAQSSWYVSPEQQLKRVYQLNGERGWGFGIQDIPSVPEDVTLRDGEVLLLVVYLPRKGKQSGLLRTIDELWSASEAPTGYTKSRWDELKSDAKLIRQAPDYLWKPGVRWVIFNPTAYQGKSPEQALELSKQDNVQLAGIEGLMAALLFPTWATSWNGTDSPFPNLSGLQFCWNYDWLLVLCLNRWDDYRQVRFDAHWDDYVLSHWCSPSFRECKN